MLHSWILVEPRKVGRGAQDKQISQENYARCIVEPLFAVPEV